MILALTNIKECAFPGVVNAYIDSMWQLGLLLYSSRFASLERESANVCVYAQQQEGEMR